MSTKTSIKRIALVAVSALGFGMLAVVPASAAARTATATVAPVRVTFTGAVQDAVSAAAVTIATSDAGWTAADLPADDGKEGTVTVSLTTAPNAAATITIASTNFETATDGSVTLASGGVLTDTNDSVNTVAESIAGLTFAANTAGTYKGTIVIDGTTDASDTLEMSFSFTTTGAPASISTSKTAVNFAAVNTITGTNTISLLDAAGNKTQSSTVDSLAVTTSGNGVKIALTTGATLDNTNLKDGSESYVFTSNGTADSVTITVTPQGTLPASGVAAKTFTVTTTGYGVETAVATELSSPSATSVVATGTAVDAEAAYDVDKSASSLVFKVSGYTAGAAYKIVVDNTGVDTVTAKDDTSNTTAADAAGDLTLYGIVGSTGSVTVTVTVAGITAADSIGIGANNGDDDTTDASDSLVTFVTSAYAASITTPSVTPSMSKTGSAIAVAGSIADQFGNPLSGATVTVTGSVTTTDATPADLTGTATTSADGSWSLTLPAATSLTTSVSIVAAAAKTGATITDSAAKVVNLTASGSPASMTWSAIGDEDTYTDLAPLTTYPAAVVPYTGSVTGNSDELYTVATGLTDGTLNAADGCVAFTATTTPGSQVVFTGSTGVKFTKTSCATAQTLASLKDTVTVGSGVTAYAVATKTGLNTVTMTSGSVAKTAKCYGYNVLTAASAGDAIRNLSVDKSTLSLNAGQIGFITITATDAFGNLVKSAKAAAGAVVTVASTGQALLDGPALSRDYTTTDANGQIVVGVIASAAAGSATISVTSTGAYLGCLAGRSTCTSTTAGTNGLTASVSTGSTAVTVVGNTTDAAVTAGTKADAATTEAAKATAAAAANATAIAALTALVEKLIADKAASDKTTAAAIAANASAIQDVLDIATDASSNAADAIDAANLAAEAADAATAAAQDVADAVAAVAEQVTAAQDISTEATEAANAATDAANAAAEAADNAGSVAQEAVDAANEAVASVTALGTQLATFAASVKAQITTLTNLVVKIQKKVKA